jgi:hypothetical protein
MSSSLDIECSILDIPLGAEKMIFRQNLFVQNELPQFIFIAAALSLMCDGRARGAQGYTRR